MSLEPLPQAHLRIILDGLPLFEKYGLVLAGGYALRAHRALTRPSQDIDLATQAQTPLEFITDMVAESYRALGYKVTVFEGNPRFSRMLLTLPDRSESVELDLLKEALRPDIITVALPGGALLPALPLRDAVGLKVRALHDRQVVRDIIDIHAAAALGGYSFIELENLCRGHEPEFNPRFVAAHLGNVPLFTDEDFAEYGLGERKIAEVRDFAFQWHSDLEARIAEEEALAAEF